MPFNLFHRKKAEQEETESPSISEQKPEQTPETSIGAPSETVESASVEENEAQQQPESKPNPEASVAEPAPQEEPEEHPAGTPVAIESQPETEQPVALMPEKQEETPSPIEPAPKIYLKAVPLKDLTDVENVKEAVTNGNIIILRITPLAGKSIEDVKKAVNDLFEFTESAGGDIARLGEERVVICPKTVRIWREKTPTPVAKRDPLPPTTA